MAFETPGFAFSLEASGDLSAAQHHCVNVDGNGQVAVVSGSGDDVAAILQNDPNAQGNEASLMKTGISKVVAGAAVAVGVLVMSNASGRAILATSGQVVFGRSLEAAGGDGETIPVLLGETQILP